MAGCIPPHHSLITALCRGSLSYVLMPVASKTIILLLMGAFYSCSGDVPNVTQQLALLGWTMAHHASSPPSAEQDTACRTFDEALRHDVGSQICTNEKAPSNATLPAFMVSALHLRGRLLEVLPRFTAVGLPTVEVFTFQKESPDRLAHLKTCGAVAEGVKVCCISCSHHPRPVCADGMALEFSPGLERLRRGVSLLLDSRRLMWRQ